MNRIGTFALLSAATILSLASSLPAEQPLKANVPFAFSVANRTLPAGEYRIQHHGAFLSLENWDNHRTTTVIAMPGERSKDGRSFLLFDQAQGVVSLRCVVTPEGLSSVQVAASRTRSHAQDVEHRQVFMDGAQQ